jgi:cytochrome c-type biogenesis protein CcmE
MTQVTWEKPVGIDNLPQAKRAGVQWKFVLAGAILLGAIAFLIISQTTAGAQYYITVENLLTSNKYTGQTVRLSGAVIGDSIKYDSEKLIIEFSIANIPNNIENLEKALYQAANDPNAMRLPVRVENQVKPDLLKGEAQAILTGKLGADGVFHASELLLKCPSRFQEADPNKAIAQPGK